MIRHTHRETVKLTPAKARELAQMTPMPGERPLDPKRMENFAQKIQHGSFYSPHWAIVVHDGTAYRADGQHTSTLLASLPKDMPSADGGAIRVDFPEGLEVTIDRFEIDEANELTFVFDQFNSPDSVRTNRDKLAFYRGQFDDLRGVDLRVIGSAVAGVAEAKRVAIGKGPMFADLLLQSAPRARERGALLAAAEVRAFVHWLWQFRDTKHATSTGVGLMAKPGLVAEMYLEWKEDAAVATEFWGHTFREDHPDPYHETRMLVDQVRESGSKKGRGTSSYRKLASKMWKRHLRMREAAA